MTAVLLGSTGLTGSSLARLLLADRSITRVISVSRRPLNIADAKLIEVIIPDLAELPAIESQIHGQLYFCCLGTTIRAAGSKENFEKIDHAAVVAFARIAKNHEASSFTLVSAMGANAGSALFYNRVKGRTEDDIKALGLRSLTIFRPIFLVGPRRESRLTERIVTGILVPFSRLFPVRVQKRFVTKVQTLTTRMLAEGKSSPAGVRVISAKNI